MKNQLKPILLPTEDITTLYLSAQKELCLLSPSINDGHGGSNQYIHLTSNREIADGELCYDERLEMIVRCKSKKSVAIANNPNSEYKKIEFTNSPKLIADGVPVIDENTKVWTKHIDCQGLGVYYPSTKCICKNGKIEVNFLEYFCQQYNQKQPTKEVCETCGQEDCHDLDVEEQSVNAKAVDEVSMAKDEANKKEHENIKLDYRDGVFYGFQQGFKANQALQSNAGFSLEDMRKCWNYAGDWFGERKQVVVNFDKFIQSIKVPSKQEMGMWCEMEEVNGDIIVAMPPMVQKIKRIKLKDGFPIIHFL